MKTKQEIIEFCTIVSKCHSYPIHYFHMQELSWEYPTPPTDFITKYQEQLLKVSSNLTLFKTSEGLLYGSVSSKDHENLIIVGPVSLTSLTFDSIVKIIKIFELTSDSKNLLRSYLGRSCGYSLPHLRNILTLINFYLNQESEYTSHLQLEKNCFLNDEIHSQYLEADKEEFSYSYFLSAFNYEKGILADVKNGNVKGIITRSATSDNMHIGILSTSEIRQIKNIFICTTTLVTRASIEGGLGIKTAYQLSDSYMQKAEVLTSSDALKELTNTMLLDFTERTRNAKWDNDVPFDIFECLQYIRQNTHTPLRVEMLAANMHISKSQLDRRFKKILNFSPSEFIQRCKLEEAKDLLLNTNRPISEISHLLCYSSQSHFCKAYKKKYGTSPLEHRRQHTTE